MIFDENGFFASVIGFNSLFNRDPYNPIPSMYGIFTYIWLNFMVNVGKYTIHGWYGNGLL